MAEDVEERQRRGETRSWYRVPSQGTSERSRRVAWAVDDEDWQFYRGKVLKGSSTERKMELLGAWLEKHQGTGYEERASIQVWNYVGALLRGGQLRKDAEGRLEIVR